MGLIHRRSLVRIRRAAGILVLGVMFVGASILATGSSASAQGWHHRGPYYPRYHGYRYYGPGYAAYWRRGYYPPRYYYGRPYWHGFYWHGRRYFTRYGYGYGYPYYPYVYPYYIYPRYVPAAVYVAPPPPPPRPVVQPAVMTPPPRPRIFNVYFDFDRYDLTPEGAAVVNRAVTMAEQGAPSEIQVTGNTDRAGTQRYNMELSRRRAITVRNYMIAHGIAPHEIAINWVGESRPAVPTPNGVRDPRNRRVRIMIGAGAEAPPPPPMSRAPSNYRPGVRPAAVRSAPPPPPPPGSAPEAQSVGPPTHLVNP